MSIACIKAHDDMYFTESMAQALMGQGHYEDALTIYKILADTSPDNEAFRARIVSLKTLAERGRASRQVKMENR
ncbi:MAG: hypothetical protein HY886_00495 [Deltaproteobacteria bacterium]|nr:hypothetical protein [Deltaproteobacteria bacterium]